MRAVLQRVSRASVRVDAEVIGSIGQGLLVLLAVAESDGPEQARRLAAKTAELRIFPADGSHFSRSLLETGGAALVVSQFTLLADVRKGRRPSFTQAASPVVAAQLVDAYAQGLRDLGVPVEAGRFGAHMMVDLENDGPVTLILDSGDLEKPRRGS